MANTLTGLIPTIYEALDMVANEPVGFIPSVTVNPGGKNLDRAAKDQTISYPIAPASTAADITPAVTAPDTGDQVITPGTLSISKARAVPVRWNGEESQSLKTGDRPQLGNIKRDQFAQAFRTLRNEIEVTLASLYTKASRAYGTAGTTPFATDLSMTSNLKKILDDNGCPDDGERTYVVDTTAGVNLRNLVNLNQANTAGSDQTLRRGALLPLHGFNVKESANVQSHTAGTMTGADCTAIEPIGETTVACDGSDSGTVLAGDVVTTDNAGDSNKYVVNSGSTLTGNASGNFILNSPGMRVATAVADEWTIGSAYTANLAFHKSALVLITRLPALPEEGDMADDRYVVIDPVTGIAYEISVYKQYKQVHYEVAVVWGYACVKQDFVAIGLG